MIPIRLTIEGLYSYQARQTIEFGPLLDAELFGIFGATGSGKSSILDAIFYALYNKTERLEGTVAGGTAYNMMNLKANRLWIDFEFALSQNANHKYRYTVEYKRNSKQYQKIGQAKRGYFSWEHGNWMPKDALSAESLIGLNYDNFKRTIIIPQGKFQDFISLRDKDRANMLEDIFGLNKYELSGHVKILKTQNEQALAHLQGQLQAYQLVSEALIEENQDEIKALNLQLEEFQQALNQIQVQYDQLNQLHDLITRQQALTEEWQALENQQPQINQRREQLQQYLIVIRDFETQLADHKRLTEEMNRTNQALSIMKADYDEEQLGVQRESNLFEEKIKPAFDQRETLKQQADEYLFLLKLKEKQETLTAIQQRWEKGKGVMAKSKQQSATFSHQITQLEEEVEQMKGQLPDLEVLRAIEQWITHKKRWQEKLAEQQQQIDEIQLEIEAARNQKRTLLASTDLDPRQHELPVQQILSLLNDRLATHQSQLGEYQKQLHQLAVQHQLASLAHELKPGEACPLCGATDHPKVENHTPSPHQKERLEKQLAEKTQTIEQFRNLLPRLESLQSEAQKIAKKRKQFNDLIQQSERELTLHESRFIWSEFDPSKENAIELQLQKHKGIQSDIEALELRVRSLRQSQKDETQNQQQYQTALDQLNQEFAKLEGEIQAGRQNLQYFSLEKEGTLRGDQLHDLAEKLLNDYKGITDSYERLNRNLQTRKNRLSELLGKIEGEEQHFHHKSKEIAQLNLSLEKILARSPFATLQEVKALLDRPIDIEAEQEAIRSYEATYTKCQTSLNNITAEIGDRTLDQNELSELKTDIANRKSRLDALKQKIGGLLEYGQRLAQQWEEKQALEKQFQQLSFRKENLKIMEGLFKGKGFVKYVSTMHLENLCAAANERFLKLSRNALSLEVDENNQFHIRDLLNSGKRRSIKTLSGGQTFQAALCLALALSDQVQQQVQAKQNFFFLDEGFGSQDKDSLQIIFQTLKALRKENRIVGVISHVEELQQEIDSYLYVYRDPEKGSSIQVRV